MCSERCDIYKEEESKIHDVFAVMAKSTPSDITSMNYAACALSSVRSTIADLHNNRDLHNSPTQRTLFGIFRLVDKQWRSFPTPEIKDNECVVLQNLSKRCPLCQRFTLSS